MKALALAAVLLAMPAEAQVFSAGASLPMLEYNGSSQPVQFAPGLGVEGAVGFFQAGFFGKEYDLLNLSVQLFGNAPGSFQAAALVGTLNNLIGIGVAVPLASASGAGAFQGSWHAYPVFSLSIPIAFGPYSPPTGTEGGPTGLPRGFTLYVP